MTTEAIVQATEVSKSPEQTIQDTVDLFKRTLESDLVTLSKPRTFKSPTEAVTDTTKSVGVIAADGKRYRLESNCLSTGSKPGETVYMLKVLNPSEHTEIKETRATGLEFGFVEGFPIVVETHSGLMNGRHKEHSFEKSAPVDVEQACGKFVGLRAVTEDELYR